MHDANVIGYGLFMTLVSDQLAACVKQCRLPDAKPPASLIYVAGARVVAQAGLRTSGARASRPHAPPRRD